MRRECRKSQPLYDGRGFILPAGSDIISENIRKEVAGMQNIEWDHLTPEEQKKQLYQNQKKTLDLFLERNAITKEQYEKSLGDLTVKMGMGK